MCAGTLYEARRDLLWIDDEMSELDAAVRLLCLDGLTVDCARSGIGGLAQARTAAYNAVILDLLLPDVAGLVVLQCLRASDPSMPVLILTGYPDFDTAVAVMRSGAWDCKAKTVLIGDEWPDIVRALVQDGRSTHSDATPHDVPGGRHRTAKESLAGPRCASPSHELHESRQSIVRELALLLAERRIDLWSFLAYSEALRLTIAQSPDSLVAHADVSGYFLKNTAARRADCWQDTRVREVVDGLERAGTAAGSVRQAALAASLGVDRAHLARIIQGQTGFTFREWRWACLLRPSTVLLATTTEQIAQIAYRCGYASAVQFDHDFRRLLGMTPTHYRSLTSGIHHRQGSESVVSVG